MWIFGFSLGLCPTELRNLVFSLEYLVSNVRQVLLGGIRLGGSATKPMTCSDIEFVVIACVHHCMASHPRLAGE